MQLKHCEVYLSILRNQFAEAAFTLNKICFTMFLYRILIALVDWQSPLTVIITLISMEPLLSQNIMYMFNHSTVVRSMLIWYNSQWEWLLMYTNIVKQIFKDICKITNISISNYFYKYCCSFTLMHLADAFIQSNLQCIQVIIVFVSMCVLWELNPRPFALLTRNALPLSHRLSVYHF